VNNSGIQDSPGQISKTPAFALEQFEIFDAMRILNLFPEFFKTVARLTDYYFLQGAKGLPFHQFV